MKNKSYLFVVSGKRRVVVRAQNVPHAYDVLEYKHGHRRDEVRSVREVYRPAKIAA